MSPRLTDQSITVTSSWPSAAAPWPGPLTTPEPRRIAELRSLDRWYLHHAGPPSRDCSIEADDRAVDLDRGTPEIETDLVILGPDQVDRLAEELERHEQQSSSAGEVVATTGAFIEPAVETHRLVRLVRRHGWTGIVRPIGGDSVVMVRRGGGPGTLVDRALRRLRTVGTVVGVQARRAFGGRRIVRQLSGTLRIRLMVDSAELATNLLQALRGRHDLDLGGAAARVITGIAKAASATAMIAALKVTTAAAATVIALPAVPLAATVAVGIAVAVSVGFALDAIDDRIGLTELVDAAIGSGRTWIGARIDAVEERIRWWDLLFHLEFLRFIDRRTFPDEW